MTGKQHITIGSGLGLVGSYAYLGGNLSPENLKTVVVPAVVGSALGAILVDIDSKKSKASQIFNKILLGIILSLVLGHYLDLPLLDDIMVYTKEGILGNLALFVFLVNVVLGKLSGHRLYTHRWLGTLVFIVSFYLAFSPVVSVGFAVGYISHILADRTTPAGKNLKFFKLQLPMTNSKGKFHISI